MKMFKRLVSFVLALLTLTSVIPASVISVRAAPSNAEMTDNYVLDSMEYLGFDIEGFKESGKMYTGAEEGIDYAPDDIRYVDSGSAKGTETTADSGTPTGLAPYLTQFRYSGMCCGSFVTYYYLNYLPNMNDALKKLGMPGSFFKNSDNFTPYIMIWSQWRGVLSGIGSNVVFCR